MLPIILAIKDETERNMFGEIYLRYEDKLYHKALYYVDKEDLAKECVQAAYLIFMQKIDNVCDLEELYIKNLLMKFTRCVAINKFWDNERRKAYEVSISDTEDGSDMEIPDMSQSIEQLVISQENVNRIAEIIEGLPDIYGDILYFRCNLRMSNTEIAEALGIEVNTVNQRVLRAKNKLLEKLKEI